MEYNFKETNAARKELREVLKEKYMIRVSDKWLYRYIYLFTHHTPQNKVANMIEATHYCLDKVELFAYFIWGARADHFDKKKKDEHGKQTVSHHRV